jgi:hypothetical protein
MPREQPTGFRRNPNAIGQTFTPAAAPNPFGTTAPADPFSMFDDPGTSMLMQTIKHQMGEYSKPVTMDDDTAGVLGWLKGQMSAPTAIAGNGLLGDFINEGRKRITELNQEPFSATEENALRVRTRDDLTRQRDTQKRTALEDISRRGMADTSGLLVDREKGIDDAYIQADAKAANDLMLFISDQRNQRKNQASTIAGQLAAAGAQDAQMTNAARANQQGQIMQAAAAIANIAAQQRGEGRANQQQVLNLAAMMAQLPMDRLNMMLNVLNGTGGGPAGVNSAFGNTLALSNQQQQQNAYNSQGQAAFMGGISQLLSYLANRGAS